ncbi:hypothetical protein MW887_005955 [Aspergillus wentii]|nr:hypothetical protein MW887_005955 [Aspergillus wentii]
MVSGRKKAFTKRSRSGCRTCRTRRIKCDETPGSCRNCTSAGWKCDGYSTNRPVPGNQSHDTPSLSLYRIDKSIPGETTDERRGFAFFQQWTIPNMTGFFDCRLWSDLILPMCHSEKAVNYAVVGLSALHEELEVRGVPLSREDLSSHGHRFALEQYGRSLSALNIRRHSRDPKLCEVVLTCCLLFVMLELTRGQYDLAFMHVRQGLLIIQDKSRDSSSSIWTLRSDDVEISLAQTMARLDAQSVFFGIEAPRLNLYPGETGQIEGADDFQTLSDARRGFDVLLSSATHFLNAVNSLPSEERLSCHHPDLGERQLHLRIQLEEYMVRLQRSKIQLKGNKEQRGIDLIHLHEKTLSILLETSLTGTEEPNYDIYTDDFKNILASCVRIAQSFWEDGPARPTLVLDMGIIPPLLLACDKCCDSRMRQQGLRLLEAWPHREGPWDSRLIVIILKQIISIEDEAANSESGVQDAFLHVEDDQTHAVLTYRTKETGRIEKRIKLDYS